MGAKILYKNESMKKKVKEGGAKRNNIIDVIIKYLKKMDDDDLDRMLDYINHLSVN